MGSPFDACVRNHQLTALVDPREAGARICASCSITSASRTSSAAAGPQWLADISALAELPDVSIKLSGTPPEADPGRPVGPQAGPFLQRGARRVRRVALHARQRLAGLDGDPASARARGVVRPRVRRARGVATTNATQLGWRTASSSTASARRGLVGFGILVRVRRTELLDAEQVGRHPDARALRVAPQQLVEDRAVLGLGLADRAAMRDGTPEPRSEGAPDEGVDDRGERAGCRSRGR